MESTVSMVEILANYPPVFHKRGPNHRIWIRKAFSLFCFFYCNPHIVPIFHLVTSLPFFNPQKTLPCQKNSGLRKNSAIKKPALKQSISEPVLPQCKPCPSSYICRLLKPNGIQEAPKNDTTFTFFHPDYTVGFGIPLIRLLPFDKSHRIMPCGSWALPPVGNSLYQKKSPCPEDFYLIYYIQIITAGKLCQMNVCFQQMHTLIHNFPQFVIFLL
jgi:hypothetical protein